MNSPKVAPPRSLPTPPTTANAREDVVSKAWGIPTTTNTTATMRNKRKPMFAQRSIVRQN